MTSAWHDLEAELARTAAAGRTTRFWLRDDDAVTVTPALERLARLCGSARMPILLAVIPAGAREELADWLAVHPEVRPCQHGWSHTNHARAGERACELGGERTDRIVLAELRRGADTLRALLGEVLEPILVPPWNRIRPTLLSDLPALGYGALSRFGRPSPGAPLGLPEINSDVDIIDWRNGRRGRSVEDLCQRLTTLVAHARQDGAPIGLLTHHLAHDDAAWLFLEQFFGRMHRTPGVAFTAAEATLG